MLNDYIQSYIAAKKEGDKKKMEQIERDLAKLGMDRMTLRAVVADTEKNQLICGFPIDLGGGYAIVQP